MAIVIQSPWQAMNMDRCVSLQPFRPDPVATVILTAGTMIRGSQEFQRLAAGLARSWPHSTTRKEREVQCSD
jgi:hypothetical protein